MWVRSISRLFVTRKRAQYHLIHEPEPSQLASFSQASSAAVIEPSGFSSDGDEALLTISTRAEINSTMDVSREVISVYDNQNNDQNSPYFVLSLSPSAKRPSPDLDAILSFGSFDSVQDPKWIPPSKKKKHRYIHLIVKMKCHCCH